MAELKNTYVNGNLAARKIYEGGTAIENKYGASLGISGSTIQLKDYKGNVLSSAILPAGSHDVTVTNSITKAPTVAVSGTATGFTASTSATSYYVTTSGTPTNGSVTSNATCTSTAGYIGAGTDVASDTDVITPTVTGSGNKIYIPVGDCTKNNFTVETTNNSGISIVHTAGYVPASTNYIKTITVPTKKTLSSVTLTSGDSSARTYLTTATVNPYTTISTLNLSGVITLLDHNSGGYVSTQDLGEGGAIETLISSDGYIGTVSGALAIDNVGTSSTASTLTVGTNTYGTVNVWNTGGDKGVQVTNHTVKVDGTTVTNDSGDLIIASGVSIENQGQYDVTIGNENTSSSGSGYYPLTQTQLAISASTPGWFSSGTDASVVVGRIKKGTITNNTSGGTSTNTIPRGKQIKIGSGYHAADKYYTAQSNSGTKTITNNGYHAVDGYTRALVDVHNTPDSYAYLLGVGNGATIIEGTYLGLHVEGTDCSNNVYYNNLILVDEFYSDDDNYGSLLFKATCENIGGGSGEYHWFLSFDNYYFSGRIGSTAPDPAD